MLKCSLKRTTARFTNRLCSCLQSVSWNLTTASVSFGLGCRENQDPLYKGSYSTNRMERGVVTRHFEKQYLQKIQMCLVLCIKLVIKRIIHLELQANYFYNFSARLCNWIIENYSCITLCRNMYLCSMMFTKYKYVRASVLSCSFYVCGYRLSTKRKQRASLALKMMNDVSGLHYPSLSACLHQNKYHTTGQINHRLFPIPSGQQGTPFSITLRTSEELQAETSAKYIPAG